MSDEGQTTDQPAGKSEKKGRTGRIANLKPFKRGSGAARDPRINYKGRPVTKPITDALRKRAFKKLTERELKDLAAKSGIKLPMGTTWADMYALALGQQIMKGNVEAFEVNAERLDGPVPTEISGPQGGPIELKDESVYDRVIAITERIRDRAAQRQDTGNPKR